MSKFALAIFISVTMNACFYSTMLVCPDGRKIYTAGMGIEKNLTCAPEKTEEVTTVDE